ncbi:MAG: InlB B-repeat-containing protein, partial [Bacillota bacterium]|nr:InlB B-repeat-containing protein [Bacillota bacterium]
MRSIKTKVFAYVLSALIALTMIPNFSTIFAEDVETVKDTSQTTVEQSADDQGTAVQPEQNEQKDQAGQDDSQAVSDEEDSEVAEPAENESAADESKDSSSQDQNKEKDTDNSETAADTSDSESQDSGEKDEQEEAYPAADFEKTLSGMTVRINAPEGALPEGVSVSVEAVAKSEVKDSVNKLIDDAKVVKAVDITFYNEKGKEIEPKKDVSVTFESKTFKDLDNASIVHIKDDGNAEDVADSRVNPDKAKATFKSDEFSVYVVVETGENARLSVVFHQADDETVTIKVKKADLDPDVIDTLIYDPGAGDVSGMVFGGWTTEEDYDAETESNTIDGVRDIVREELNKSYNDGDVLDIYAMLFKQFNVSYLDTHGTSLGLDVVKFRADSPATSHSYTVNMNYEAEDNDHHFEGWYVDEGGSNIEGYDPDAHEGKGTLYENDEEITIKGDVVFSVNAPEGRFLIFNENGKGATYNAPIFLETGETTYKPCPDEDMKRFGYTFDGWYNGTEDDEGNINLTTPFEFGGTISDHTTIYAKWSANTSAKYTVIFWTQNSKSIGKETLDPDTDYDLKASAVVEGGEVGEAIPYEIVNNGAEDYAKIDGENYHYTGFCAKAPAEDVIITAEGDAVLNIYYDRIKYNLRFYLYRQQGNGNNSYSYAQNSNAGRNVWGIATWYENTSQGNMPTTTYGLTKTESTIGGYYGYYFVLSAYYGEDISSKWPTYEQITGPANNRQPVSFIMMNGAALKGNGPNDNGWGDGRDTVKGTITVLDDKILGATDDVNGNYLIVRFNSYNTWNYHICFETPEGGSYEEDHIVVARSSNTNVTQQSPPQFEGFEYVGRSDRYETGTPQNRIYNVDFRYKRLKYKVNYMDGLYIDGNGSTVKVKTDNELSQSADIAYGATIPTGVKNYVPDLPEGEAGYVFEGWYADKACTTKYEFGTMPIGGITVYAKWREIQYRVFLHPNAGTDPTLEWGDDNVAMTFRVSFGGKVSTPTGVRTGYEFAGWYWDKACKRGFNSKAFVLNEETVPSTPAYNKETDFTDKMNKWGNVSGDSTHAGPWNSDLTGDGGKERFWITKKLDLYAKWRSVTDGSNGITVVYDAEDGYFPGDAHPSTRTDEHLYVDKAEAVGGAASTPNDDDKYFLYWVLQTWDPDAKEYTDTDTHILPSEDYTVLLSNAEPYITKWVNPKNEDDEVAPTDPNSLTPPDDVHTKIGEATYTVKLRAEYGDREAPTQTHIIWYANGGTGGDDGFVLDPEAGKSLKVNESIDIRPADTFTREGYKFLGWAREGFTDKEPLNDDGTINKSAFSEDDDAELWLEWDGEKFTEKGTDITAEYIAADEAAPYQELYAVWCKKLKITIKDKTTTYNGAEQSGYGAPESVTGTGSDIDTDEYKIEGLEDGDELTISGYAPSKGTNAGTYNNGSFEDAVIKITRNGKDVTKKYDIETIAGKLKIDPTDVTVTITGDNNTTDYDGEEHGVSGYDVQISDPLYTEDDFTFSGTAEAKRTDAGTTDMGLLEGQFTNTNENFNVTFEVIDGYQTINPIDVTVTITGHNNTTKYDSEEHSVSGYDVQISNPLYTEADFTFSGTAEAARTDVGTTHMQLDSDQFENMNENFNVTFEVTDGYQRITEPDKVVVTITGHNNTTAYDGEEHSVSGYDVQISNPVYTEDDFTFSGTAEAKRTDAGKTDMGLAEDQFENTNPSFTDVEFVVIDGYQTISPINVTVTITGHNNTTDYDGEEHSVSGYDVEFSN